MFVKSKTYLLKIQVRIILGGQLPELRVHSKRWLRWNLLHSGILTFAVSYFFVEMKIIGSSMDSND